MTPAHYQMLLVMLGWSMSAHARLRHAVFLGFADIALEHVPLQPIRNLYQCARHTHAVQCAVSRQVLPVLQMCLLHAFEVLGIEQCAGHTPLLTTET